MTAMYAFSTAEGGLPASIAITWSLWAIFAHQTFSGFMYWLSLVCAVLALIYVVNGAIVIWSGPVVVAHGERTPLLR